MKVALLLTGQLRTHELCKHIIKASIVDRYDTDVFMSIDRSNTWQNEMRSDPNDTEENKIQNAISWYQPKEYVVTDQPDHSVPDWLDNQLNPYVVVWRTRLLFAQYAIVKKAYDLLKAHVSVTGTKYDLVIRLRFDQLLWNANSTAIQECMEKSSEAASPNHQEMDVIYNQTNIDTAKALSKRFTLSLDPGEPNTVHTFGFGLVHGYPYVNEQLWTHGHDLIDRFAEFYNEMPGLLLGCTQSFFPDRGCLIEHLFYKFIFKHRFNLKKSVLLGVLVREFLRN
jgi:hypothetical protein